jgi:hypothetical protein
MSFANLIGRYQGKGLHKHFSSRFYEVAPQLWAQGGLMLFFAPGIIVT